MPTDYVPDKLYQRLLTPWVLPEAEWPLCKEDWARVDAITSLPWAGRVLDVGAGDSTLAAMVCSRHPEVQQVDCYEPDPIQVRRATSLWHEWRALRWWQESFAGVPKAREGQYDGALCCEVLEHLTPSEGAQVLRQIHSCLRPGARFCASVPDENGSRAHYPGHLRFFNAERLAAEVEAGGFSDLGLQWILGIWLMVTARA